MELQQKETEDIFPTFWSLLYKFWVSIIVYVHGRSGKTCVSLQREIYLFNQSNIIKNVSGFSAFHRVLQKTCSF